ncbi:MAG: prepilin-type N-terminal cleavage/methylation domain-containing protein [Actinobacteria bacterium]|nr:prepilin-type N-terminal cleavage/methylation domain-containing protein [Actinomycetota bacterium]MCL6104148.1 prepilin-type N-terminal cleavage/methylation domain-containing protein [Actinomycetota bacterium]
MSKLAIYQHHSIYQHHRVRAKAILDTKSISEEGFSLIELAVVLLIMAIMMAIAIPTFLGVRSSADNRKSQTNLTNALTVSGTLYDITNSFIPNSVASSSPCYGTSNSTNSSLPSTACMLSLDNAFLVFCANGAPVGPNTTSSPCYGGGKPGASSANPNAVSVMHHSTGQFIQLASAAPGTQLCWLILNAKSSTDLSGLPHPGVYYAEAKITPTSPCSVNSTTFGWTPNGFPTGQ